MQRPTSREEIAANVREAMTDRRVDQAEIVQIIGKSAASVSERVRGITHFRVDELQLIAAYLEVPLEQLLEADQAEAAS